MKIKIHEIKLSEIYEYEIIFLIPRKQHIMGVWVIKGILKYKTEATGEGRKLLMRSFYSFSYSRNIIMVANMIEVCSIHGKA